ncbi:hypothetical protein CHUAL_003606 [Chamberlinius hualienensis]
MDLHTWLLILGILIHIKAIDTQSQTYPIRKITKESYVDAHTITYLCTFYKPVQHCMWYYNSFPFDPKEYGFQYNRVTNGVNTLDCSISSRYPMFNLTQNSLICVGVREVYLTTASIGDQLQLPCFSDSPVHCQWKDQKNRVIKSSHIFQFHTDSTDCTLNITYAHPQHFGIWICHVENSFRILAVNYVNNNNNNGGTTNGLQRYTTHRKKPKHEIGKEDYQFCKSHSSDSYITNYNGLIAGLCVACLTVIVLIAIVIYLCKIQKQNTPAKHSNTARIVPTIKLVNSNAVGSGPTDPNEGLVSVPVTATKNFNNKIKSQPSLINNESNIEMEMYADVAIPEAYSTRSEVPQIAVGDVTYATIIRHKPFT